MYNNDIIIFLSYFCQQIWVY